MGDSPESARSLRACGQLASIFGVRHFSPAAALHVARHLDAVDPDVVLIEGPSDATEQLVHLAHAKTVPPVAVLAFTKERPVRTILYPLAAYSAEWIAARWALKKKRQVRFIDLPAAVFLEMHEQERKRAEAEAEAARAQEQKGEGEAEEGDGGAGTAAATVTGESETHAYLDDPYEAIARIAGDSDHETWWERHFEHADSVEAYRGAIFEFGKGLRDVRTDSEARTRETLIREAHMRREILEATRGGKKTAVVVCGAYHAPVLTTEHPAMTDAELADLPRTECVLTLMPYSYPRLSSQSGYGAGNHAPAYFEALHEELSEGRPHRIRARYLASVAAHLRKQGILRSSAEVIEAVRLAEGLASMTGSHVTALRDLRDAAVTLLGHGEGTPLQASLRAVEIGTAVGKLPPGVSRTALQDDFHQLVATLKLGKYIEDKEQELELDLREDRTKKTKEAAFLDLARSTFLHRLEVLDVAFAKTSARDQRGTAFEAWKLRWTPECEIRLAERSLMADSIESGAAFALAERLATSKDVGEATRVLLLAANCELADALTLAMRRVQELTVEEAGFPSATEGIFNLMEVVRYGNVRHVDPAPLRPIVQQLYLRSTLLLEGACICDDDASKAVRAGMDRTQDLAFLGEDGIEPKLWTDALRKVAQSDSKNPILSGYAMALLIERNLVTDEDIDREVARRLSPGSDASVGVGWFEGLVQRNRAALFMRQPLWSSLSSYVESMDDDAFRRGLLYLRRAFSTFSQGEIRRVVGLLGEAWKGIGAADLASQVEKKLDEAEVAKLADDLGDLDLL
jgi:hypothetical protein